MYKAHLPELIQNVVNTYSTCDKIHNLGHCALPNYSEVTEGLSLIREILFPGYQQRSHLNPENITYYVGDLLDRLYDLFSTQISRALCQSRNIADQATTIGDTLFSIDPCNSGNVSAECKSSRRTKYEQFGHETTLALLQRIPHLREILATDAQAAYAGDPACTSVEEVVFCYPGFSAITTYRIAHELHLLGVPLIPRMMTEWAHSHTGIDIHPGAKIGPYFFIDHGTGVVIGETCELGAWVKLYQGVTLGALSFPTDELGNLVRGVKRHPTLEDNVVIYANATVLGGNTVLGHHCVIGSSVWITSSVAPHTTVTLEKPAVRVRNSDGI